MATFNKLGLNCVVETIVNLPTPTINCPGVTQSLSPTPFLTNGQAYTGTITIPYTVSVTQPYASDVVTSNGLTFTRAAGNFTAPSGNVVYNISGTYTGTSFAGITVPFNVGGTTCNVLIGQSRAYRTGTYTSRNASDAIQNYSSCPAPTPATVASDVFINSWGSPTSSANDRLQVDFPTALTIDKVVISGGTSNSCWGGSTAGYPIQNIVLEYWNGTTWVNSGATVPFINTTSTLITINLPTNITTTRLRLRNTDNRWWVIFIQWHFFNNFR